MSDSSARQYLCLFAAFTLGLTAAVCLLNWRVDPLQYYRKAVYAPEFSDQKRYQNPGLARNYPYDAVIAGTSVSLGFDLKHAGEQLGCSPLNVAMQGASAHEQHLMARLALRTGKVRRVMWDLNYEFLRGEPEWVSDFEGVFPAYLYDTNPLNEISDYLLNLDTTKSSVRILLRRAIGKSPKPMNLQELSQLSHQRKPGRASVLEAWRRVRKNGWAHAKKPHEFASAKTRASFERNYLSLIQEYPGVTFDLWFPPFSIAYHALVQEQAPEIFEEMLRWKQFVREAVQPYPNVRLHDFQGVPEIVFQLDRYTDTVHFDAATHREVVEAFATGQAIATSERLRATEEFLRAEARPARVEAE